MTWIDIFSLVVATSQASGSTPEVIGPTNVYFQGYFIEFKASVGMCSIERAGPWSQIKTFSVSKIDSCHLAQYTKFTAEIA